MNINQLDEAINTSNLSIEDLNQYIKHLTDVKTKRLLEEKTTLKFGIGDVLYYHSPDEINIIKVNYINLDENSVIADTITIRLWSTTSRILMTNDESWSLNSSWFNVSYFKKINIDWNKLLEIVVDFETRLDHLQDEKINDIMRIIDINS